MDFKRHGRRRKGVKGERDSAGAETKSGSPPGRGKGWVLK